MISLKRLIQKNESPSRALKQAYSESEAALARIAHVNRLSRDIMDIKHYEVDLSGGSSAFIRISSKKGIVDLVNFDGSTTDFYVTLQNPELTQEREKFYVQLTAYTTGSAVPVIFGTGFAPDTFSLRINDVAATQDWGLVYFYYEIVKID